MYFDSQILPALAAGNSCSWFLCPFNTPPSLWVFCVLWSNSLFIGTAPCSRLILCTTYPHLRISHFPKSWFLLLIQETKTWVLGIFIATWASLLPESPSSQSKKIMCTFQPFYIQISIGILICNCLLQYQVNKSSY